MSDKILLIRGARPKLDDKKWPFLPTKENSWGDSVDSYN